MPVWRGCLSQMHQAQADEMTVVHTGDVENRLRWDEMDDLGLKLGSGKDRLR
jgi:hypothetical protein